MRPKTPTCLFTNFDALLITDYNLANFKKIVLICVKRRWITQDPFGEFKMTKKKVKKTPLTQHQVDELARKHFSSDRLTVVRDIFLFCCYTVY